MSATTRSVRALSENPAAATRWTTPESLLFFVCLAILVLSDFAIHLWLGQSLDSNDVHDALSLEKVRFGVHIAVAIGVLTLGGLAWILDRRRRALAQALIRAQEDLRRQAKLDLDNRRLTLLSTLASGLAHELGQPLSAARVGVEGIHYLRQLGREPTPEHLERTLSQIGMSLVAMTQTIDHLRSLATTQSCELQALDLGACVEAVLNERGQWLRLQDVPIEWTRPEKPVLVLGEAGGIRLLLINLLRNAVEAVAPQGRERRLVRVSVGPGPLLAVHDSGPGIPPERLAVLFDPFQSTKGGAGRGIGLSLALASAQRMGAELTVSSQLGSGTVFTLRLQGSQALDKGVETP
jgi:C4-dicarboxylate-specific signal transduction histidine kinase